MIDNKPDLSWFKFYLKRSSQMISQIASGGASLTQDDVPDGVNAKQFTAIEQTKLASITSPYLAKGAWDASTGLFPANTFTGWTYVVSVDGVVDGVDFKVSDTISSLVDNALTTTYAANWLKEDNTATSDPSKADKVLNTLDIADLPTGGSIGTAITTVDIYEKFNINQTTAAQTVTIPNPTLSTNKKLIYVENIGSKSFSLYDLDLEPSTIRVLYFNGTDWITAGGGGGDAKLNPLAITDLATGGSIGTAITTVDIYNKFNINQTTAAQTITVPNPTLTTEEKLIYVENIGSKSFSLYDIDVKPSSIRILVFNGTDWITAGGGGEDDNKADKVLNSLDIADLATGGSIGTSAATVDIYEKFNINQTTADQTITVPNPTLSTNKKIIYVANIGSSSFTIQGLSLSPSTHTTLIFISTSWTIASDNKGGGGSGYGIISTGGIKTEISEAGQDYIVHTFLSTGQFNIVYDGTLDLEYLVVAGGGGGASRDTAGGGGAGGMLTGTIVNPPAFSDITITVGTGGAGGSTLPGQNGSNGGNSSISNLVVAIGGGGGAYYNAGKPSTGGSGGGEAGVGNSGSGNGTAGQGNNGGRSTDNTAGGGGGGSNSVGSDGINLLGGDGGDGSSSTIQTGVAKYYAAGGAGTPHRTWGSPISLGGNGGGGDGGTTTLPPLDGVDGTGSGGGASRSASSSSVNGKVLAYGAKGGSGIVIVRYKKV